MSDDPLTFLSYAVDEGGGAGGARAGGEKRFTQAELDAAVKAAEAAARKAESERLKGEAEKQKPAEEGELLKLLETERAEKTRLQQELAARDLADRKRQIAEKHQLSPELAERLKGSTAEELEADARALAKQFPPAETGGNGGVGNPGGSRSTKLNKDQIAELARRNPEEFNARWERGEFKDVMQGR